MCRGNLPHEDETGKKGQSQMFHLGPNRMRYVELLKLGISREVVFITLLLKDIFHHDEASIEPCANIQGRPQAAYGWTTMPTSRILS